MEPPSPKHEKWHTLSVAESGEERGTSLCFPFSRKDAVSETNRIDRK
jgi:hypothetical protein